MKRYNQNDIFMCDDALTYDDINFIPNESDVNSRFKVNINTVLVGDVSLTNPLIPANMDTITEIDMMIAAAESGSIAFLHRFMSIDEGVNQMKMFCDRFLINDKRFRPPIGVSVGINLDTELTRVNEYLNTFIDNCVDKNDRLVLLIDVAHGHHIGVKNAIVEYRKLIDDKKLSNKVFIIAGNVATKEGAKFLINAGAHGVKVGVGNGGLCETRIRTGAGVPQVSALAEVAHVLKDSELTKSLTYKPTMIADGGVKYPGDVVKALWFGAGGVMSGYLFAGTNETPGTIMKKGLFPNEIEFKIYRGSASHASKLDRGESSFIEGNVKEIMAKGSAKYIFSQIKDGVSSGLSYAGAWNLQDFINKAKVCRITQSGIIEARPNLLER